MAFRIILFGAFIITFVIAVPVESPYKLNIIHHNDFHARFDETNLNLATCDPSISPCIGGFARLYDLVKQLVSQHPESLILNAGDSFQGTMWYNIFGWNTTQHFMNLIPHDAHAFGNHEFDSGLDPLIRYLKALNAPVLAANIDASQEPTMKPFYKNSIVVEKLGRKVGIIGVTTTTSQTNYRVGKLKFLDETDAVRKESSHLKDQGVNIIIVLSHCGFDIDNLALPKAWHLNISVLVPIVSADQNFTERVIPQKDGVIEHDYNFLWQRDQSSKIADQGGENVDVIVGGHTHTLLYTGEAPSLERPEDFYPVVVNRTNGHQVLIVQAASFTKYLGQLIVSFDDDGDIVSWSGEPIYLGPSVPRNHMIVEELEPYKKEIDKVINNIIGYTKVKLDLNSCYSGECNLGDFVCDTFVEKTVAIAKNSNWSEASICVLNSGALRYAIDPGAITHGSLYVAVPFNNSVNVFDLRGKFLKSALEKSVSKSWRLVPRFAGPFTLQVSGLRVVFNLTEPVGNRVKSLEVRCSHCELPRYFPLIMNKVYRVVSIEYLTQGGDGFSDISDHLSNLQMIGTDLHIIEEYIKKQSPITQDIDGRIIMIQ